MYWLHCLSPVHVGSGQGVGVIDMPIMREKVTDWPLIPGSAMKGVLRERLSSKGKSSEWLNVAFGQPTTIEDPERRNGNAGALVLSDSRLFAFPVASRYGTFAYVTCLLAVKRMMRDLTAAALPTDLPFHQPEDVWDGSSTYITPSSDSVLTAAGGSGSQVYLDEFESVAVASEELGKLADWIGGQVFEDEISRRMLKERLVLVPDEMFQYFVTMCCEIAPRIRILPDTKTVDEGALWYEEYLPTESILYGLVWCDKIYSYSGVLTERGLLNELNQTWALQIGGNASIGKGRVLCRFPEGALS